MVKLKSFASRISQSMWLIAIANIKDLFEVSESLVGVLQKDLLLKEVKIDWSHIIVISILAFVTVNLFRALAASKDSVEAMKKDYESQKNKFADQSFVASVVNAHRLQIIVGQNIKFANKEIENSYLQQTLDSERELIRGYLRELNKDRTGEDIDRMIEDFYQIDFWADDQDHKHQ